jgi:putative transposase
LKELWHLSKFTSTLYCPRETKSLFLILAKRITVWKHIKENATEKGIFIDMINGYSDHCHCLISLRSDLNIEKVIQLIKSESSHWINKNNYKVHFTTLFKKIPFGKNYRNS